jgi:hypothetical protein
MLTRSGKACVDYLKRKQDIMIDFSVLKSILKVLMIISIS